MEHAKFMPKIIKIVWLQRLRFGLLSVAFANWISEWLVVKKTDGEFHRGKACPCLKYDFGQASEKQAGGGLSDLQSEQRQCMTRIE